MPPRIHPLWWPVLAAGSPVLVPALLVRNRLLVRNAARAQRKNRERLAGARPESLPELESLELTVLVEWEAEPGFRSAAGVSYLFRTDRGSLLFDVGFGPDDGVLAHNAGRLGVSLADVDALAVSHLHLDHMGGFQASRKREVRLPGELGHPGGQPCLVPDRAIAPGFKTLLVERPQPLAAGIWSTGPLARSLFFLGWTEEQALLARVKGKGLCVFTGCGHPGLELILELARRVAGEPIYAIVGGLHFPLTAARSKILGVQLQMVMGTGLPPWKRITAADLDRAIAAIQAVDPARVLLSAHDTCDEAIRRFQQALPGRVETLKAGGKYRL